MNRLQAYRRLSVKPLPVLLSTAGFWFVLCIDFLSRPGLVLAKLDDEVLTYRY